MADNSTVSVVIPTCDRPTEFLGQAVSSAIGQSLPPHQIIVVDNGRKAVDASLLPEGVILYRLAPRVGPSRARNFGAAMASGDLLAFLDDDDFWDEGFLKEACAVMRKEGTRCVYGRKDVFRDNTRKPYKIPEANQITIPILLERNPGTGGMNLVVFKELYWRVAGFDETLRVSEDRAFALEVLKSGEKISVAPQAIAVMRSHEGERLRRSPIARLGFVWKYRELLGFAKSARRITSIFGKALRQKASSLLH